MADRSTDGVTVGKFYRVSAVRVHEWHGLCNSWVLVVGPKHEDREIIGFQWEHFHVDWRFAPKRVFDYLVSIRDEESGVHGWTVLDPDTHGNRVILEGPTLRRMKCKRDVPPYPSQRATWLPKLRERFACAKLTNGHCPHRGIPVSAMRREGDVLVCPGHGLRWSATTGELIR